jgi:hypothetical protein
MFATSWYLDRLPDYLWLVMVLEPSQRDLAFDASSRLMTVLEGRDCDPLELTLQSLADCSQETFTAIIGPFRFNRRLSQSLCCLSALPELPGRERWAEAFGPAPEDFKERILRACRAAAPQDSRPATDVAFLDYVSDLVQGRLKMPAGLLRADAINQYPHNPDDALMDGSVRAYRNAKASMGRAPGEARSSWVNSFYGWGQRETGCSGFGIEAPELPELQKRADEVIRAVSNVQIDCIEALTGEFQEHGHSDAREVTAGLCLYSCDVARTVLLTSNVSLTSGVVLLRTMAEVDILLHHLLVKGQSEIIRYRQYGSGRAKLLVNKIEELGEGASSFNFLEFSNVASERADEMFIDMPLTGFYKPNLRDLAIAAGVKEVYDKYYDICSTFSHAEWGATATTAVQMCANPLHLGHYVPSYRYLPIELMDDVEWLVSRLPKLLERARTLPGARPTV